MAKVRMKILVLLSTLFISVSCAACTVTDDAGNQIQLEKPARRVISLAPDITEILFAAGAGSHVIGVMQGSDYPAAARDIPVIGSYTGLDLEKIYTLRPDLIVSWGNMFPRQIAALKKLHIPVYINSPRRLEDIPRAMRQLGCLTGEEHAASLAAERFSHALAGLRKQYSGKESLRVFYQIGSYSLMTVNKDSWINQMISLCGGRNVFADLPAIAPEISWESLLAARPDAIISDDSQPGWKQRWQTRRSVPAVQRGALFAVNADLVERAGPRLLDGVREICVDLERVRSLNKI